MGLRRKTVDTIEKITGTMKLVAQAQLNKVSQRAKELEPFYKNVVCAIENRFDNETTTEGGSTDGKKIMTLLVTTNRGLCGSLNSQMVRDVLRSDEVISPNGSIFIYGDKGSMAIEKRAEASKVVGSAHPTKHVSLNDLAHISSFILQREFDELLIVYNKLISNSVFEQSQVRIPSVKSILSKVTDLPFEIEESPDELYKDYQEYLLTSALHYTTLQNTASETLSRRNAMDGANKNCKELKVKLSIIFNKLRQALITTELIEITSGAAVVEEMEQK